MALAQPYKDRTLIATIGDEDTITGLLLAGTGHISANKTNFFKVDPKTPASSIEAKFQEFTERTDIAIILINQHVADLIRGPIEAYTLPFPAVLEVPSKEHPYDPSKDSILKRVRKLFGE